MHLDALLVRVVDAHVPPLAGPEIGAHEPVQVQQQVQVERSRDTERVVVRRFEDGDRLDEVDADQQAATTGLRVDAAQEITGLRGREVADAGARIEEDWPAHDPVVGHRECVAEVDAEPRHLDARMLAGESLEGGAKEVDRDVDGDIALRLQGVEEGAGLGAVAGAEVDQRADISDRLADP